MPGYRHLTQEEREERLQAIQNFGVQQAAKMYGVSWRAMKNLAERWLTPKAPQPLNGLTPDKIVDVLLSRCERLRLVGRELEGARAKIRQLESMLESEKAARERVEGLRQAELHERLARVVAQPGD